MGFSGVVEGSLQWVLTGIQEGPLSRVPKGVL